MPIAVESLDFRSNMKIRYHEHHHTYSEFQFEVSTSEVTLDPVSVGGDGRLLFVKGAG